MSPNTYEVWNPFATLPPSAYLRSSLWAHRFSYPYGASLWTETSRFSVNHAYFGCQHAAGV